MHLFKVKEIKTYEQTMLLEDGYFAICIYIWSYTTRAILEYGVTIFDNILAAPET